MAITPVPVVSPIPPFPPLSDRVLGTYNSKAYAFGVHMSTTFMGDLLALVNCTKDNAVVAYDAAAVATAQAAAAAALVNAPKWVMGTNYPTDSAAWSPTDKQTYRRNAPGGVSNVDPYLDSTPGAGWTRVGGGGSASAPDFLLFPLGIF